MIKGIIMMPNFQEKSKFFGCEAFNTGDNNEAVGSDSKANDTLAVRRLESGKKPRNKTMKLVKREKRGENPQSSKEQCKKYYVQMNNASIPQWRRITHENENNGTLAIDSKEKGCKPNKTYSQNKKEKDIIMISNFQEKSNTGDNNDKLAVDSKESGGNPRKNMVQLRKKTVHVISNRTCSTTISNCTYMSIAQQWWAKLRWAKLTYDKIAEESELSARTAKSRMKEAKQIGCIKIEQRSKNPLDHTNSYCILDERKLREEIKDGDILADVLLAHMNKYEPGFKYVKQKKYYPCPGIKAKMLKSRINKLKAKSNQSAQPVTDDPICTITKGNNNINILNASINAKNDSEPSTNANNEGKQFNDGQKRVSEATKILNEIFPELKGHYDLKDILQFDNRQVKLATAIGRASLKCNNDEQTIKRFFLKSREKLLDKLKNKLTYDCIKMFLSLILSFSFVDKTLGEIAEERLEEFRAAFQVVKQHSVFSQGKSENIVSDSEASEAVGSGTEGSERFASETEGVETKRSFVCEHANVCEHTNTAPAGSRSEERSEVINKVIKAVGKDNYNTWFKNKEGVILCLENGKCVCKLTQSGFVTDMIKTRYGDDLREEGIEVMETYGNPLCGSEFSEAVVSDSEASDRCNNESIDYDVNNYTYLSEEVKEYMKEDAERTLNRNKDFNLMELIKEKVKKWRH